MTDYREVNRANWDDRAPAHAASPDYDFAALRDGSGASERRGPVRPAAARRHLRPARRPPAVPHRHGHPVAGPARRHHDRARLLARRRWSRPGGSADAAGTAVGFVESDVYDALDALGGGTFDLVYTGIGALCWLPDIRRWARTVAALLRPGRAAVHPRGPSGAVVARRGPRPTTCRAGRPVLRAGRAAGLGRGRHVRRDRRRVHAQRTHEWNHGLGEIVTAVLDAGMTAHRAGRARERAVGGAARTDAAASRAASGSSPTIRSGCRTPIPCRRRRRPAGLRLKIDAYGVFRGHPSTTRGDSDACWFYRRLHRHHLAHHRRGRRRQRGYFKDTGDASCAKAGTVMVTIVAGPLNWLGVNPKISCDVPQPSK